MQLARDLREPPAAGRDRVWFAHAIRGPACLLVIFAHLFELFPQFPTVVAQIGHFQPVGGLPRVPWASVLDVLHRIHVSPGHIGVLLFFLVSGFVIPFSLRRGGPGGFFLRRFFRLYPTLWVCLLTTAAVLTAQAHLAGSPPPFAEQSLAANALLVSPYARLPWIEPVLWSLAIEELFYVIAATLAWRGLLSSRVAVVAAGTGLALVALLTRSAAPDGALYWLGFNATGVTFVLVGVVAHHLYRRTWRRSEALAIGAALLGLYALATADGPAAGLAQLYLRSSVVALAVFAALYGARDRLPYSRRLDRLSDISYPLYLLHGVNGYVVLRALYVLTGNYYVSSAATVLIALAAASAVHRWVETPTNNVGRILSHRLRARSEPAAHAPALVAGTTP